METTYLLKNQYPEKGKAKHQHYLYGFTLVELLVVISIIALLLSILMPSLSKARDQGRKIVCATRLKDIGLALNFYAGDNNNNLPTSDEWWIPDVKASGYGRWMAKLLKYYKPALKSLQGGASLPDVYTNECYHCPTQDKKYSKSAAGTYGYNIYFSHEFCTDPDKKEQYEWSKLADIKTPSAVPLMGCLNGDGYMGLGSQESDDETKRGGIIMITNSGPHPLAYKYGYEGGSPVFGAKWHINGPAPNHRGQCNFLFADFHVQGRNVCNKNAWPWFGNPSTNTTFHPQHNLRVLPR